MSRMLSLPVRAQLLLMTLIVAVPAAVSIVYSGAVLRDQAIEAAISETRRLCDRVSAEQEHLTGSAEQLLITLAQLPDVKDHRADNMHRILHDIVELNPLYLNISITDRNGMLWASAVGNKPVYLGDRRCFINAMARRQFSTGEFLISRVTGEPTINFCYPFSGPDGGLAGGIIVSFRLDQLGKSMPPPKWPGASCVILDRSGTVMSSQFLQGSHVGKPDLRARFRRIQGGPDEGTIVVAGHDGKERYTTYRKLRLKGEKEPYLYVRVGVPVETVVALANRTLRENLALYASCLVLAFLIAWTVGKRSILDRIKALQGASRRLAEGDLQVRVSELVKGGELGSLGQAFDDMARRLAERERERERAERSLRESESRYRSIFDNALFGIALSGPDHLLVQVNDAFAGIVGYPAGELAGKKALVDLVHPEDRGWMEELRAKLVAGEVRRYTVERNLVTRLGRVKRGVIFIEGVFGSGGRYLGDTACILDVTEHKVSEEQLRLFFERQLVGMAIVSPGSGWVKTNEKLRAMLGYSAKDLSRLNWQDLVWPEDLPRNLAQYERMVAGEIDEYSIETHFVRREGSHLYAEVSVGCVRQPDGAIEYLLILLDDVTLRKYAEEEIEQLQSTLERRVLERTAQLEAAIREQESFSYSVSHDLRSPLRHINSYLAIVMEEFADQLTGDARYYLERACAASVKMGKLIDDLLELSRVSRSELVREQVDLSDLASGVVSMLQETEPERLVEVSIAQDLVTRGDRVLINLVLVNLLGNAWKYSSKRDRARVELGAVDEGGHRVFFVKDNGTGFDMAYKDKLFGPFQRLHGEEYDGTGIGLATVRRIMERHGGDVWAEAQLGVGATFYFRFP